jgi:hypothetical protein
MATGQSNNAGRYGGYGQSGYDEESADEPGVQADFDEQETREAGAETPSRQGAKPQSRNPAQEN